MAAEIGTRKVINEHSTIGLVVTTDGSISDIPREEYEEAEERVINELKQINKPFIVLLNCMYPSSAGSMDMAADLSVKYGVPVMPVNCLEMTEEEIKDIISKVLFEFPVREIAVDMPHWITSLEGSHNLRDDLFGTIKNAGAKIQHIRDISFLTEAISGCDAVESAEISGVDLGIGSARINVKIQGQIFYQVLTDTTGLDIHDEKDLITCMAQLVDIKKKYDRVKDALDEVETTGYGIVMPSKEELSLEEPEIMKQGGRYGVRLRASAPSIHMMKAEITTEVNPIVGSEKQSEDLVMYLLQEFEEDPIKIWESNIFGKSLHELVNEGLHTKLSRMPSDARMRMQETLERVINEGCSGLICIIL